MNEVTGARKRLIFGGNWKAAMTPTKAEEFMKYFAGAKGLQQQMRLRDAGCTVIIGAPAVGLILVREAIKYSCDPEVVKLAVQDPWIKAGAYTGATTFEDAVDPKIMAEYAIIGHSETRESWRTIENAIKRVMSGELRMSGDITGQILLLATAVMSDAGIGTDKPRPFRQALDPVVNQMVKTALNNKITPILCVGESEKEKDDKLTAVVVESQIRKGLAGISADEIRKIVIAYEPVWAIGTGKTATPEEAQKVHYWIARILMELTGDERNSVPVIYGGSMNAKNAADLVKQPDIHGGLIGGASLTPEFFELIEKGLEAVA
jgi:triosephosphate isomerase